MFVTRENIYAMREIHLSINRRTSTSRKACLTADKEGRHPSFPGRRYAWECQTQEGGWGLDGVLREQSWKLRGIVNGMDYGEWSPQARFFPIFNRLNSIIFLMCGVY